MLAEGVDVNKPNSASFTALHVAAGAGQQDVCAFLLDKGAAINAQGWNNQTPLHWAAMTGRKEVVELLIGKQAALALPSPPFDPFVPASAKVDKYQTVRFDTNRYSVPRRWAFTTVTVKAYVDRIDVISTDSVIASHRRRYAQGEWIVEPRHYLAILGRRPAALDHSFVFDRWALPACFEQLREDFERRYGPLTGARQYVRVLQLLAEYPMKVVQEAIGQTRSKATVNADHIITTNHAAWRESRTCQWCS